MNSDVVTVEENEDIEVAADRIRQLDEYEIPVTKMEAYRHLKGQGNNQLRSYG